VTVAAIMRITISRRFEWVFGGLSGACHGGRCFGRPRFAMTTFNFSVHGDRSLRLVRLSGRSEIAAARR
jgi:hypothetical protein